jgi:aminoglycoside phosphotransferase (APT) family kinase protein
VGLFPGRAARREVCVRTDKRRRDGPRQEQSAVVTASAVTSFAPNVTVLLSTAQEIVDRSVPGHRLTAITRLHGGEMGTVFELWLSDAPSLVLKIYPREFPWKMHKEVGLCALLQGRLSVAVPRILYADDAGSLLPFAFVVASKLPGEGLAAVVDTLAADVVLSAYAQMGRLLRELHDIPMSAFGYLGSHGLLTPHAGNHAYIRARFDDKLTQFAARGGEPALARRISRHVSAHAHLLDACAKPVLCHNDFHAGNILAAADAGGVRLTGILDFEGAQAADPLMDLAKALYCDPRVDDARRSALLDGYRVSADTPWQARVALYRLYYALEFWCWMALLGNVAQLPPLAAALDRQTAA